MLNLRSSIARRLAHNLTAQEHRLPSFRKKIVMRVDLQIRTRQAQREYMTQMGMMKTKKRQSLRALSNFEKDFIGMQHTGL